MLSMKMVVVGNLCVGKTSLINRFVKRKFDAYQEPTIGGYYQRLSVEVYGLNDTVEIWEASGLERAKQVRQIYYRNTDVFNVVFSVVSPHSFENVEKYWIPEIRDQCPNIPILLVGNMIDLRNNTGNNQITTEMGKGLACKINAIKYIECSCLTNAGISDVLQQNVKAANRSRRIKEAIKNPKALRKKSKQSEKFKTCAIITNHHSDVIDPPVVHYYSAR